MNTMDNSTENNSIVNLVNISRTPLALVATSNNNINIVHTPTQNRNARNGMELETEKSCNISSNTSVDLLAPMITRG